MPFAVNVNLSLSIIGPITPGGGVLPYKRLMGMCHWMRSHFDEWIDCNEVAFSMKLLEWGRSFLFSVSKPTRMFVLQMKSKLFFIQSKKWVNS